MIAASMMDRVVHTDSLGHTDNHQVDEPRIDNQRDDTWPRLEERLAVYRRVWRTDNLRYGSVGLYGCSCSHFIKQ